MAIDSVCVATYNVNHVCKGPSNMATARTISTCGANIVCLQEVNPQWQTFLSSDPAVNKAFPFQMFHHQPRNPWGGFACLSAYPIDSFDIIPETDAWWYPAGRVMISLSSDSNEEKSSLLQLLIVHLRAPVVWSRKRFWWGGHADWISGFFSKQVKAARLGEIQAFCNQLKKDVPTVVVGDFNERPRGACVQYLESKGFRDIPKAGYFWNTHTWSWGICGVPCLCFDYDYLLCSEELEAIGSAEILKSGGSDHRLVMATFTTNNDRERTFHTSSSSGLSDKF